jgi:alpha-tubulin suppressor-like RCC1 family protein
VNTYLSDKYVADISCDALRKLVLTNQAEVYAWGCNNHGQVRNGRKIYLLIPAKVNYFNGENVMAISCKYFHSLELTESGLIFSWGLNNSGQLGL